MAKFILSGFADEASPMLDDQIRVLNSLDMHYIEPRKVDNKVISDYTPQEAQGIMERLQAGGIAVSAVGSPMGKISITDPFGPHLDDMKRTIEIAQVLKAKYIRMFSFFIPEDEDPARYQKEVLNRLEQFVKAAQGSGVTLLHENEKHIYGDIGKRCLEIMEAFKGEMYATFDPSNYVQCGENTIECFEMLRPYIKYMHFKDSVYTSQKAVLDKGFDTVSDAHRPVGMGDGNFKYILAELVKMNFEGFCSVEPHLTKNDQFGKTHEEKFIIAATQAKKIIQEALGER